MLLQAEPIIDCVLKIKKSLDKKKTKSKVILFTPAGKDFTNIKARNLAKKYQDIILICGRYEGIDARVVKVLKPELITVGPYVLTGGELPAMIVLDSVSRQIDGVLGRKESLEEERVSSSEVYTRPEVIEYMGKKYRVPKVLVSGDHKKIEQWRVNKGKGS